MQKKNPNKKKYYQDNENDLSTSLEDLEIEEANEQLQENIKQLKEGDFINLNEEDKFTNAEQIPKQNQNQLSQEDTSEICNLIQEAESIVKEIDILKLINSQKQMLVSQSQHINSFLEAKNSILLSYYQCLLFYIALKIQSYDKIESHPVIKRLIYYKTLLQKLQPLQSKIQNQIESLLKQQKQTENEDNLELYKPNLFNLNNELETQDNYRDPHQQPMLSKEEKKKIKQQEQRQKQAKSQFLNSKIGKELINEVEENLEDAPKKIGLNQDEYGYDEFDYFSKEMQKNEEENFKRMQITKKQQKLQQKRMKELRNDELLIYYDNFDTILGENVSQGQEEEKLKLTLEKHEMNKKKFMDEFYKVQLNQQKPKAKVKHQYKELQEIQDEDDARNINSQMLRNKGLMRFRKKSDRNPRVKHKLKFEKQTKKLKVQILTLINQQIEQQLVKKFSKKQSNYQGEKAIKDQIVKGVQLK